MATMVEVPSGTVTRASSSNRVWPATVAARAWAWVERRRLSRSMLGLLTAPPTMASSSMSARLAVRGAGAFLREGAAGARPAPLPEARAASLLAGTLSSSSVS